MSFTLYQIFVSTLFFYCVSIWLFSEFSQFSSFLTELISQITCSGYPTDNLIQKRILKKDLKKMSIPLICAGLCIFLHRNPCFFTRNQKPYFYTRSHISTTETISIRPKSYFYPKNHISTPEFIYLHRKPYFYTRNHHLTLETMLLHQNHFSTQDTTFLHRKSYFYTKTIVLHKKSYF